jgi:hypothetical protein
MLWYNDTTKMPTMMSTKLPMLFLYICSFLRLCCGSEQYDSHLAPLASRPLEPSLFSINSTWQVLGPFQIGTRGKLDSIFHLVDECVVDVPR